MSCLYSRLFILIQCFLFIRVSFELTCHCNEGTDCNNGTCQTRLPDGYCDMEIFVNNSIVTQCIFEGDSFFNTDCTRPGSENMFIKVPGDPGSLRSCCQNRNLCNECPPDNICQFRNFTDIANLDLPSDCSVECPVSRTIRDTSPTPSTSTTAPPSSSSLPTGTTIIIIITVVFGIVVASAVIGLILYMVLGQRRRTRDADPSETELEEVTSSGISSSFNGPRLLTTRTVSHDIQKVVKIGNGRFGEVWLCKQNNINIAVKVFRNSDWPAWNREKEIYDTYMLSHDNILRFLGSDRFEYTHSIELWTLFEYHEKGNLQDFLRSKEVMTFDEAHFMCVSLVRGVQYLHKTLHAGKLKPGIAHRDLKSRNILVKNDTSLCLADLGMAVKQSENGEGVDEVPTNKLSGTKRYMSPEILNGTMNYIKFTSYTRSDIYSMSLVLWEIYVCCQVNGIGRSYSPPYYGLVSDDPDVEQMQECVLKHRPVIPDTWIHAGHNLNTVKTVLEESWSNSPTVRPTALGILKKLEKIESKQSLRLEVA